MTSSFTLDTAGEVPHIPRLDLRPVTRDEARAFVREHHRHHSWPQGFLWLHGLHDDDGSLVGIAVCGRPVARPLDDGLTMEVTRLCTDGEPNANSMLYAATEKAAKAKGYRRWLTYVLESEWDRFDETGKRIGGAGLRAAGWHELWRVKGRSWDCESRPRTDKHPTDNKVAVGGGAWPPRARKQDSAPTLGNDGRVYLREGGDG